MSGDISIQFLARTTLDGPTLGHAFICISLPTGTGPKEECFGFYPESIKDTFGGPGKLTNEFSKEAIKHVSTSLRHVIDEQTRSDVYSIIKQWAGADYQLRISNCGDFTFAVAKAAGLTTPNRATVTLPTEFVDGLKRLFWGGSWLSDDVESRFGFIISGRDVDWSERSSSGAKLTKKATLKEDGSGGATVERENSADVLHHLGFADSIIPDILAAGPKPSFFKIARKVKKIVGQWNGLVVTKDEKGKFKEIRQPGSNSAKQFTFDKIA